jgi:hypothetical protein
MANTLRSARRLIAAGYLAPLLGYGVGLMLPRGGDELGIGNAVFAMLLGVVVGGALLVAGLIAASRAPKRSASPRSWRDYLLIVAGLAPFVVVVAGLALSKLSP